MKKTMLVLMLFLLLLPLSATVRYVDNTHPDADDGNTGTESAPWKTIQYAVGQAGPGDTVFVGGGTYAENVTVTTSGLPGRLLVLISDPDDRAVIDGNNIVLDRVSYVQVYGFRVQNCPGTGIMVKGPGSEHVTIAHNHTYNTVGSGISAWGVPWQQDPGNYRNIKNLAIEYNKVEKACNGGWNECITLANGVDTFRIVHNEVYNGGDGTNGGEGIDIKEGAANGIVANNRVHGLSRRALYIDAGGLLGFTPPQCHDIEVYGNICYTNSGCGFAIMTEGDGNVHDIKVYNNVFYGNSSDGIMYYKHPAGTGNIYNIVTVNNTCYSNGRNGILSNFSTSLNMTFRNNICYLSQSRDLYLQSGQNVQSHNLTGVDPVFKDAAGGDFHLQEGSPAINAGTLADAPDTDGDGNERSDGQPDIGAYEYRTTGMRDQHPGRVVRYPVSGTGTGYVYDLTGRMLPDSGERPAGIYLVPGKERLEKRIEAR